MLRHFYRINLRVIVLTLLLLVAFDLLLRYVVLPHQLNPQLTTSSSMSALPVPSIKRLPADDKDTLALWKRQLAQDKGYKVVFLGDSVVHGGGVPLENQTIAAYFARELKILRPDQEIKVYNFSLPGCTPADTYNIFSYIADTKPDLVIYDLNIGWFGSAKIEEHPRLEELAASAGPVAQSNPKVKPPTTEDNLTDFVSKHWTLYQNRIFLNYLWFGGPLKEQLKVGSKTVDKATNNELPNQNDEDKYKPWYEKNFDILRQTKGKLGYVRLDEQNQHWVNYEKLMAKIQAEQINAAVFTIPRNEVLYVKYDLLDKPILKQRQQQLTKVAAASGVQFFDYTYMVSDRWFVDSVHLTREGNEQVARKLAHDLVQARVIK